MSSVPPPKVASVIAGRGLVADTSLCRALLPTFDPHPVDGPAFMRFKAQLSVSQNVTASGAREADTALDAMCRVAMAFYESSSNQAYCRDEDGELCMVKWVKVYAKDREQGQALVEGALRAKVIRSIGFSLHDVSVLWGRKDLAEVCFVFRVNLGYMHRA